MKNAPKGQAGLLFLLALALLGGTAVGTGVYVDAQTKARQQAEAQYADAKVIVTKLSETTQTQAETADKQAQAAIAQAEVSKQTIEALQQNYKDLSALYEKQMAAMSEQLNAERTRDATMVNVYQGVAIAAAVYAALLVLILATALVWVMNKTEQFRNRLMEHANIQIPAGTASQVPMERPAQIFVSTPARQNVEVRK